MKKLLLIIAIMISFVILMSVFVVGVGNYSLNGIKIIPQLLVKSNDIVIKKNNSEGADINVYITKENKIISISLEEYVAGVVAGEMPTGFGVEALKAQAVAARTYGIAHMEFYGGKRYSKENDADVCDTSQCQIYMTEDERLKAWLPLDLQKREALWEKITDAVQSTSGQVLTYDGELVMDPFYFAISAGRTENVSQVFNFSEPYLKSVLSPGEQIAPKYSSSVQFSIYNFIKKVNGAYPKAKLNSKNIKNQIWIDSRAEGGSVIKIKLGNISISGSQFRSIFALNSSDFTLKRGTSKFTINCLGYGHDIGMSQWGANIMSKSGKSYTDILYHYYQGVKIEKLTKLN